MFSAFGVEMTTYFLFDLQAFIFEFVMENVSREDDCVRLTMIKESIVKSHVRGMWGFQKPHLYMKMKETFFVR